LSTLLLLLLLLPLILLLQLCLLSASSTIFLFGRARVFLRGSGPLAGFPNLLGPRPPILPCLSFYTRRAATHPEM
jgi:hypothetical protein